jgi:hypothetical protein
LDDVTSSSCHLLNEDEQSLNKPALPSNKVHKLLGRQNATTEKTCLYRNCLPDLSPPIQLLKDTYGDVKNAGIVQKISTTTVQHDSNNKSIFKKQELALNHLMVLDKQSMEQTFGEVISQLYNLSLIIKCAEQDLRTGQDCAVAETLSLWISFYSVFLSRGTPRAAAGYIHMLRGIFGTMATEKLVDTSGMSQPQ